YRNFARPPGFSCLTRSSLPSFLTRKRLSMKFGRSVPFLAIVCLVGFSAGVMGAEANSGNWPNWRGPHFNGTSLDATPPITWDEEKNVQWKVALPGKG